MKPMNILMAASVLVMASSLVNAGSHNHQYNHYKLSEKRIEKMDKQLDLSDDQVVQLQNIAEKYKQQYKAMKSSKASMKTMDTLNPNSADYKQQLEQLADQSASNKKARVLYKGNMRADIYKAWIQLRSA